MTARSLIFLSSILLILKCYQCQSVSTTSITQAGQASHLTLPVIIKPAINYESNTGSAPPSIPNFNNALDYNNFPVAPAIPPPLPPIIIDNGNGGGGNNWFSLLFLIFALRNNKGGGKSCGGGCGSSGCNCGGYGCGCGGYSRPGGYDYYENGYSGGRYENDFNPYSGYGYGSGYSSYDSDSATIPGAEIIVTPGYIDDPVLPISYSYPTIQTLPSRDPYEVRLVVRTESIS